MLADPSAAPKAAPSAAAAAAPVGRPGAGRLRWAQRAWRLLGRHWIFAALFGAGLGLRVITQLAYRPALFYIDSYKYLTGSSGYDPEGYRFLLAPILWVGNLAWVPAVQHLLGLAMGLAIYAVLIRRGAPRWAAALAAVPILLDAYQLQMEQTIMPDVVFEALILGGLAILLWKPRPSLTRILAGAFVLGLSADVRQVGELLIVPVAVFAALAAWRGHTRGREHPSEHGHPRGREHPGWRRRAGYLGLAVLCCAVPMLTYMTISQAAGQGFRLANRGSDVLYGRAAVVADCATLQLPKYEDSLCPTPAEAALGIDQLLNSPSGPYSHYQPPAGMTKHQVVGDFVARVATQQPLSMPLSVLRDGARLFALTRDGISTITPISRWQFQPTYATFPPGVTLKFVAEQGQHYGGGGPVTIRPLAAFLRGYQLHGGYTPGPLLAVMTGAGVVGSLSALGQRRRRGTRTLTADDRTLAAGTLLATLSAVTIVLGSDVFEFSWRYQLPALVTLPLAGVLGGTLLTSRLRARRHPDAPGALSPPTSESLTPEEQKTLVLVALGAVRGLVGLARPAHAGPRARVRGAVGVQLDHDLVARDVVAGDGAGALRGVDGLADAGRVLTEVLVQGMLVLQAAHQPAAGAGDAHGVDRQVLLLGHPHRDRLEVLEECGAAQVAATRADAALEPGLIAGADLPQLDPGPELAGQVADQSPEVDPARGAEVHGEGVAAGHVVHRRDLHGQLVGADEPLGRDPALGPAAAAGLVPLQVFLGGQARAHRQAADVVRDPLRGPHAFGHFRPGVGRHEHLVADGRGVRAGIQVVQPPVSFEGDRHHHAHPARVRPKPRGHEATPDRAPGSRPKPGPRPRSQG